MTDEDYRSYQGVSLVASEARVLEELEAQLGHPIPPIAAFPERDERWFGFIAEHRHVTELALDAQELPSLPASLVTLKNLRLLSLSDNRLRTLPDTIGQLQHLQRLYLCENQLQTLPETFGQLQSIGYLQSLQIPNLRNNQLVSLPDSISQLQNLQTLNLSDNQLTSLSESIGQLSSLKYIYLGSSQLVSLSESIGQLPSLQILCLANNQLTSLPESIGQLPSLKFLNLNNTPLRSSLSGMITILDLSQRKSIFKGYVPYRLFSHPLIRPLEPESITCISNSVCPFCGLLGLVSGQDKKTGKERIFCSACENSIQ